MNNKAKIRTASVGVTGGITKFRYVNVSVTDGCGITVAGMTDKAVKESLLRVCTALLSCGYSIPGKKIEISLSPLDKSAAERTGTYDLAIALGILKASGLVRLNIGEKAVIGELGLDGSIRYPEHLVETYRHGETIKSYINNINKNAKK